MKGLKSTGKDQDLTCFYPSTPRFTMSVPDSVSETCRHAPQVVRLSLLEPHHLPMCRRSAMVGPFLHLDYTVALLFDVGVSFPYIAALGERL